MAVIRVGCSTCPQTEHFRGPEKLSGPGRALAPSIYSGRWGLLVGEGPHLPPCPQGPRRMLKGILLLGVTVAACSSPPPIPPSPLLVLPLPAALPVHVVPICLAASVKTFKGRQGFAVNFDVFT